MNILYIHEFLKFLNNVKKGNNNFSSRCPSHHDKHNSLSISEGAGGRILVKCHAGCSLRDILLALKLHERDLFVSERVPSESMSFTKNTTTAETVYSYTDTAGNPIFETVRYSAAGGGKTFRQRRPTTDGYEYNLHGVEPVLYRMPRVDEAIRGNKTLYICEGEKDADNLAVYGAFATTAPMGAGKWRKGYTELLKGLKQAVVLPDNDEPGRNHALLVAETLINAGISVKITDLTDVLPNLDEKGDVSNVLEVLGESAVSLFYEKAQETEEFKEKYGYAKKYKFSTVAEYLAQNFYEELELAGIDVAITTGFCNLDEQLDGSLYPGFYVIGSVSGLGKTSFAQQMADHIAGQGSDVLFFSLEMPRMEMAARSVTREMFLKERSADRRHVHIGDVLKRRKPAIKQAVEAYGERCGRNLTYVEGDFDFNATEIENIVSDHCERRGKPPVVFVDYLQILKPPDFRMTDKQAVDHNVVALKRLSRDIKTPVIAISSFNRQNYTEDVNFSAFKESGAIEYSADFVLGLQACGVSRMSEENGSPRAIATEMRKTLIQDPRPIEAVTLKNRRGKAWARFELDFYAKQYYFAERLR